MKATLIDATCSQCGMRNCSVRAVFRTRIVQLPTHEEREDSGYRGIEVTCKQCGHIAAYVLARWMDSAQMLELMRQITDESES